MILLLAIKRVAVMGGRCLTLLLILLLCRTDFAFATTGNESAGQLWRTGERRWDVAEELRFADWVERTVDEEFFIRLGIPVDCADVPYAIRWIYARSFHLPAAATLRDGRLFGHWSTDWSSLPTNSDWKRDRRFMTALRFVLDETTTATLPADTYPIRIAPDSVLAGVVSLVPDGHAALVGRIVTDGSMFSPIQTWESTVPRKIRKLRQRSYFSPWPDRRAGTGLVRFRWPVSTGGHWHYLDKQAYPFYSDEQYRFNFNRRGELFDEAVARRIDPNPLAPSVRANKIIDSIYRYLEERVMLVREGYQHCRRANCKEGSYLWEIYSTPSRDAMIGFEVEHLLKLIDANGLDERALRKRMEGLVIPIDLGHAITMNDVVYNYAWLSHDPTDTIEARWGLNKCEMIQARMQDSIKALEFVERQYRVKDPRYADYGRSLHLADLQRLNEEGRQSGCGNLPPIPSELPFKQSVQSLLKVE